MYLFDPDILPSKKGAYIVGGSVRDLLLGRRPTDYDLAVMEEDPATFAKQLAEKTQGKYVCLGQKKSPVHRVITPAHTFDVTKARGTAIEEDLQQRDFTINAMAFCMDTHRLVDVARGRKDLALRRVGKVSDGIFKADPVRLLRAFRVAGDLGFEVTKDTLARIQKDAHRINQTSPERVRDEWQKILSGKNATHYLDQMTRTGLLFAVFPEILPMADCEQNVHHAYTVLVHTFKAFSHLERMLNTPDMQLNSPFAAAVAGWNNQRKALLKHAMLLHDMGKPRTKSVHADGTVHFYRHAAMSADMARTISRRLRFSNPATEDISRVIRMHNRPLNLFLLQNTGKSNPAPAAKFFSEASPLTLDILLHSIADHLGKTPRPPKAFVNFANSLSNDYLNAFLPLARMPKLLTGHDLITIFHLSPSPLFKKLLDTVEIERLAGTIHSKKEACTVVEKLLRKK